MPDYSKDFMAAESSSSSSPSKPATFLKKLPCFNEANFTKFPQDSVAKATKPKLYIPQVDHAPDQVIVTEKTSIMLRYLHQNWSKKNIINSGSKKRELSVDARTDQDSGPSTSSGTGSQPRRKMPRTT